MQNIEIVTFVFTLAVNVIYIFFFFRFVVNNNVNLLVLTAFLLDNEIVYKHDYDYI